MGARTDRERLRRARDRLSEWSVTARDQAYADLFKGSNPVLDESERQPLDRLDSAMSRLRGQGLWGEDEYGIIETGLADGETGPRVVCTYHPQIPYTGIRGESSLDEVTRKELNDVLWDYSQRVANYLQQELDRFLSTKS